ncbi:MAG: carboxypeptidase-like regulatory domain-containing protein [Melioribacteraceae bacterium]|nr:carboxypeptidase-like regulatory domain-containing protein [Melioribacteraceae bacterium]
MKYAILFILLIQFNLFCQQNIGRITGIILDKNTFQPIENVNVVISNTYFGSVSLSDGTFEITKLPLGIHEVVISCIGYEITVKRVNVANSKKLKIFLTPKTYNLDKVNIVGEVPEKWNEDYEVFSKLFIGEEGFYEDCKILNKEIIQFSWHNDVMKAFADEPLIVLNKALGFKIDCYLINFQWEKYKGIIKYSIKTKFTDLDSLKSEIVNENRKAAYNGTIEHFLKCLVKDEVLEGGYKVYYNSSSFDTRLRSNMDKIIARDELVKQVADKDLFIFKCDGYLKIINDRNISWLRLNQKQVMLDKNGFPIDHFPFEVQGYWARMGISEMVPKYFEFED